MMRMTGKLLTGAAALACACQGAAAAETPRVVVTLKPVHALAAGVMAGVAEPELLMPGGGSPHAYALKPSQAKSLAEAGLVIRVSESLETFLDRAIGNLAEDATVVTLDETPGLTLHKVREGGLWESHDHDAEAHGGGAGKDHDDHAGHDHGHGKETHGHAGHKEEEHGHAHGEHDAHIWLDPENARAMTAHIAAQLSRTWPAHADAFTANAERIAQRAAELDGELKASTAPLHGKPYIVFHDAYRYFEERYGLHPAGSITVSPGRAPGAGRLLEIRDRIQESGAICVFAEPQFEPKLVATLTEGSGARRGVLDPLGAALKEGPELYFTLMRNLARDLRACLTHGQ